MLMHTISASIRPDLILFFVPKPLVKIKGYFFSMNTLFASCNQKKNIHPELADLHFQNCLIYVLIHLIFDFILSEDEIFL